MKPFAHTSARTLREAAAALREASGSGKMAAVSGGGSDLLGLIKDQIIAPDVVVSLRTVANANRIARRGGRDAAFTIGGLTTLDTIAGDATLRAELPVLAEAAETVATPQIRNVATLAGNVCQRPWCWYYRNGFNCFKAGGNTCFSVAGENQFHAIFGGGPSFIVHPSDTASALLALDASFTIVGPAGERTLPAAEFFVLPRVTPARENVLADDEILASVQIPAPPRGTRSGYRKVMDREAWTHAVVSAAVVLQMDGPVCRSARIVLGGVAPIPWRVPAAEAVLAGQQVTAAVARRAAETAVAGANPLAKNRYKVPLTQALVERAIVELAS